MFPKQKYNGILCFLNKLRTTAVKIGDLTMACFAPVVYTLGGDVLETGATHI